MKIGINGYEAVVSRFGFDRETGLPIRVGSGEYCFQLLNALHDLDKKNEYKIYLPKVPSLDLPSESSRWKYVVFSAKLWTLFGLSRNFMSDRNKIDVFFSPTHYLPLHSSSSSVISILDVSYLHFPEYFNKKDLYQLKIWGKYSIMKAKKIITISKSSKNDIIREYGVSEEKIEVVYPGIKDLDVYQKKITMEDLRRKFGIEKNYILFVGTLQPRKNIERLIEAFSMIKDEKLSLVVIGKKGWMYEKIIKSPDVYGVSNRVKFLDKVSDEELPSFYKNAVCFVLPSLYEGFGLPVLEAMKYGCPVIASNVSSLPEAGGDAAVYFDPHSVDDIAEKIEKIISSEKLREDMKKKGYEQVKKFSWDKAARETLDVLENLAGK